MATYTAPTTRTTGALISASIWNTDIVENLKYFKDAPVFDGDISVGDDIFLTSTGAVINFASGDVTITHSTNTLTFAGAASGYVFNDGNVGIGVSPGSVKLDILGATAIRTASVDTNATTKEGKYVFRHYTNAEEDVMFAYVYSTSTANEIYIGGGASSQNAATQLSFSTAANSTTVTGTERLRITSGGNVAIAATAKLYLDGVAGTGDTYIAETSANVLRLYSGGTDVIICQSDGLYLGAVPTTASAANLFFNNITARVERSSSSLRYKHDIGTLDGSDALAAVMAMRPVTYRGKTDEDQRRFVGFIAEEMQEIAPLLCTYDEGGESGTPNYVTYDRVTAYLVAVVQQQQTEINALKARIH